MITISSNGRSVVAHLGKDGARMTNAISKTMNNALQPAKKTARGILMQMVYSRPENPKVPRSNNLWLSTDAMHVDNKTKQTFYVYNDPKKATNPYEWWGPGRDVGWTKNLGSYSGPEKYYPAYVSQGNFFGRYVGGTNFYQQWMLDIGVPLADKIVENVGNGLGV